MPKTNKQKKSRAIPYQKNRAFHQVHTFPQQNFTQGFHQQQDYHQAGFYHHQTAFSQQKPYMKHCKQTNPWPEQGFYDAMDPYQNPTFYQRNHFQQPYQIYPNFDYHPSPNLYQLPVPDYNNAEINFDKELIEELKKSSESIALSEQKATEKLVLEIERRLNVTPEGGFSALKLITDIKSGRSSIDEHEVSTDIEDELDEF